MITKLFVAGIIAISLGYDIFAAMKGYATESMVLRDWARDWTALPYMAGFLSGHWFGPRQQVDVSQWWIALAILIALLAIDVVWNVKFNSIPIPAWRYSLIYFMAGIPIGMYLWGQPGSWAPLQ